jgi:hypothetical protein
MQAKEVTNLVSKDLAVCMTKLDNRTTVIASLYLDIKASVITSDLENLLEFVKARRYALLLAVDSNAHNTVWGHKNNSRGETLLDFIIDNDIDIRNTGKHYTFDCATGKSVIDLTLVRHITADIKDWRVSTKLNHSDHNTIRFSLGIGMTAIPEHRQWSKMDWPKYKDSLSTKSFEIPSKLTPAALDTLVTQLYSNIEAAIEMACPLAPESQICKGNPWFTEALKDKRKHMFRLYDIWQRLKTQASEKAYKLCEKEYKKHCLTVKLNFRRDYKEKLSSEAEMAELMKQMLHKSAPQVGTIKLNNGLYSLPGTETLKAMADAHFTGHNPNWELIQPQTEVLLDQLQAMFTDIITPDRLQLAFDGFKTKKSPGPDKLPPLALKHLPPEVIKQTVIIYKAALALNYTPCSWLASRVVFIPKPGKDRYTEPKSFRPISLSNYILKGLERLVGWHSDAMLELEPVHNAQHGLPKRTQH